nr:IS6 family transposase [Paraburkholderia nodosa]
MKKRKSLYHGHRFPAAVISLAVRWYFRFQLSLRDIEELLFERGVVVSYETIRRWCDKFGVGLAHRVKVARRKPGRTWHLDEVFVTLRGEPYLLWRAVDQHVAELDILLQKHRDKAAAKRFFNRVLAACANAPRRIVIEHQTHSPEQPCDYRLIHSIWPAITFSKVMTRSPPPTRLTGIALAGFPTRRMTSGNSARIRMQHLCWVDCPNEAGGSQVNHMFPALQ